jgi:ABC-type branched-subunit amino acid transport system substrate-binding protein
LRSNSSARARSLAAIAGVTTLVTLVSACGRSSDVPTGIGAPVATATASASASASGTTTAAAGDFGTLKGICGPGTATGGSGRGLTSTEIHVGTMADPGAAAAPGLEQEFFDVGDAFTKWCNAAGGINGRKLVLDKYDAKLFEVGAQMISACQKDFMLVGNGNAFDEPGVKPRLACKLGQVPSYSESPAAFAAGLQVQATPNPSIQYQVGPFRLLGEKFPSTLKSGIAIGGSNIASLVPQGRRAKEALTDIGYKVTTLQERPPLVDNFRPYMEAIKSSGATAYNEIVSQDPTPEFTAISNVGLKLDYVLLGSQFYDAKTIAAAKATAFPPTWVYFSHLPFEMASKYPVVQQIKDIMAAGVSNPKFNDFVALAFNAWTLWAKSATACGNALSQDCVLKNAGSEKAWTAGGFFPPRDTNPSNPLQPTCYVIMKVTPNGFVYDPDVTKPNTDVYNCDAKNVVTLKSTYES